MGSYVTMSKSNHSSETIELNELEKWHLCSAPMGIANCRTIVNCVSGKKMKIWIRAHRTHCILIGVFSSKSNFAWLCERSGNDFHGAIRH